MDSSFTKVPVQVPKLSGFDKSHQNLLTSKVGTITPILIDELIPGSKVKLSVALSAQLPPLATDTFMRCSIKVEAFFCPFRLLAGSYESWFTDTPVSFQGNYINNSFVDKVGFLPVLGGISATAVGPDGSTPILSYIQRAGGLFDYLGYKTGTAYLTSNYVSALPALCYHRVYDDWYKNTIVQRPVFVRPQAGGTSSGAMDSAAPSSGVLSAATAPYYFYSQSLVSSADYIFGTLSSLRLADGKYLFDLRQRNFGLDYFTTATPTPQQGAAQVVSFATNAATGQFSIAALRSANSLQQFAERNLLSGSRYQDQLRARYGANLSSGVAQRTIFLGGASVDVYTKGIYTNANDSSASNNNPFGGTVGAKYGSASAAGKCLNIHFEANEPGYLLVNATLVPKVTYSSGIHRRFLHYVGPGSLTDLANPILQNVGPQPIYEKELTGASNNNIFGYTDRYASFKTMEDELHGLLRDSSSLASFALQRSFANNSAPTINSAFLEIPTNYMDQVTAVSNNISNFGFWLDTYFDYKVSQPLARYSLPSLQDPAYEHGKTVIVDKGGQKL